MSRQLCKLRRSLASHAPWLACPQAAPQRDEEHLYVTRSLSGGLPSLNEAAACSDFANGHDFETRELPCYLPGNGGLLSAVAMMAGGFMDGSATPVAVGFPKGWGARSEGFKSYP